MLVLAAAGLAVKAHHGQMRRYNEKGLPYVIHCFRVAEAVAEWGGCENHVAAALLHDVLEDTPMTKETLMAALGAANEDVVSTVVALTNPSKGSSAPRAVRKEQDRMHLINVPAHVKVIKMFDRIDNLRSLAGADPQFVSLYLEESRLLADVIGDGDESVKQLLLKEINDFGLFG